MNMEGEPLRILLVEDNTDHADLVMESFEERRLANQIHHVADGQAALDYLNDCSKQNVQGQTSLPHLMLLDLRLPKVDGLEVLKCIKEDRALANIPVVILTTSEAERDIAEAYEHRANSYLVKPVGYDSFSQLINILGFYWIVWNRVPWPTEKEVE